MFHLNWLILKVSVAQLAPASCLLSTISAIGGHYGRKSPLAWGCDTNHKEDEIMNHRETKCFNKATAFLSFV